MFNFENRKQRRKGRRKQQDWGLQNISALRIYAHETQVQWKIVRQGFDNQL